MGILAFAGSTRKESFNKRLLQLAVEGARAAGAEVTPIDLRDFPMPLYDGDLEASEGIPEHGRRFKQLLRDHEGMLIAAPEYNSGISGVLKNAIDWASRREGDEPALVAFKGKTAAIMSASSGNFGGVRGLPQLRHILSNIGVLVLPDQVTIPSAAAVFKEDGSLGDPAVAERARKLGGKLAEMLQRLRGPGEQENEKPRR